MNNIYYEYTTEAFDQYELEHIFYNAEMKAFEAYDIYKDNPSKLNERLQLIKEGALGDFWDKIKKTLTRIWEGLCNVARKFWTWISSFFKSNRALIDKYENSDEVVEAEGYVFKNCIEKLSPIAVWSPKEHIDRVLVEKNAVQMAPKHINEALKSSIKMNDDETIGEYKKRLQEEILGKKVKSKFDKKQVVHHFKILDAICNKRQKTYADWDNIKKKWNSVFSKGENKVAAQNALKLSNLTIAVNNVVTSAVSKLVSNCRKILMAKPIKV